MSKIDVTDELRQRIRAGVLEDAPNIIGALFEGIYELDESSRAVVLRKVGAACARTVRAAREKAMGVKYPTGVELGTACEFYVRAALHNELLKREFTCESDGDTVEIRDALADIFNGCACRLVLAGLIEPNDNQCRFCQEGFFGENFEYMTGRQLESMDCPESRTQGNHLCVARCHFKPAK